MSSHIAHDDLSAYADGEIPPPRRAEIAAHLAACRDCAEALEEIRWTVAFTRAMPLSAMPAGATLALGSSEDRGRRRRTWWLPAAAAAAALLVGSLALLRGAMPHRPPPDALVAGGIDARDAAASLERAADSEADVVTEGAVEEAALAATAPALGAYVSETPGAFALRPTPDSLLGGYPRPLATARQGDIDQRGAVPPPELSDGSTAAPAAAAPGYLGSEGAEAEIAAAPMAQPPATPADEGPRETRSDDASAADASAPGSRPATPVTVGSEAPPSGPALREAARPSARPLPGAGVAVAIAAAAVLLVLSAALFVRGWTR